jgi:hypothetical protein
MYQAACIAWRQKGDGSPEPDEESALVAVPLALLGALSFAGGQMKTLWGPRLEQGDVDMRAYYGWNDRGRARKLMWRQIFGSTKPDDDINYAPENVAFGDAVRLFNQLPWRSIVGTEGDVKTAVDNLWWSLRFNGVIIDRQTIDGIDRGGAVPRDDLSKQWARLVEKNCAAAPLESVIRDYYRSQNSRDEGDKVTIDEVHWNFDRGEFRRMEDRARVMRPYHDWSPEEAFRLFWLGLISPIELDSILKGAGIIQERDAQFIEQLVRQLPPPDQLVAWMRRDLWNADTARLYGLDDGYADSPIGKFFAERQGVNWRGPGLPDEPDGEKDWLKLAYRASCPLPMFREAVELQHRLRPAAGEGQASVVPGVSAWTPDDTRNMLDLAGYSAPIRDRMMALTVEPLNIRIIQTVLTEALKHPPVAAEAQRAFGEGVDWVQGVYLDHGFAPAIAKLAADGIRARADDEANAERIDEEKSQRAAKRKLALEYYRAGTMTAAQCRAAIVGPFFTDSMAVEATEQVDREVALALAQTQIKEIELAYKNGKLGIGQIGAQLQVAGVTPDRVVSYVSEWSWERNEQARIVETGTILSAVRAGLMLPSVALTRMVNLGWNGAEATIELTLVQHEIDMAAAKQTQAAISHTLAAQAAAARKLAAEQKAAALAATKAAKEKAKATATAQTAALEQARIVSKYDAAALLDWDAYNEAVAAGDKDKEQAELAKAAAAFQAELIAQVQLRQKEGVTSGEVGPISTKQEGNLDAAPPATPAPAGAAPSAKPATGAGGGAGSAPPAP